MYVHTVCAGRKAPHRSRLIRQARHCPGGSKGVGSLPPSLSGDRVQKARRAVMRYTLPREAMICEISPSRVPRRTPAPSSSGVYQVYELNCRFITPGGRRSLRGRGAEPGDVPAAASAYGPIAIRVLLRFWGISGSTA